MAKPSAVKGKTFDKTARKDAIAAQHVGEMDAEQQRGQAGQHAVAQHMAGAVGGGVGMDAPRRQNVGSILDQLRAIMRGLAPAS